MILRIARWLFQLPGRLFGMLAHFFSHKKRLAKLGNGLIGLLFLGFATRLATLSS